MVPMLVSESLGTFMSWEGLSEACFGGMSVCRLWAFAHHSS